VHYYKKNLGDYAKKTGRLSLLQHGAYTLLIDACYDREQFPTLEDAFDWLLPVDDAEKDAIEFILKRFFTKKGDVFVQSRIEEEINDYKAKALKNKEIAQNRENAKKTNRERTVNEPCKKREPNQEPRTKNQEPITNKKLKTSTVKSASDSTEVVEVFDFWRYTMNHAQAKLDSKRRKAIATALKMGYSVDEVKTAIVGCSLSQWHMGVNDRSTRYDGLHIILKDADQIDKFIGIHRQGGAKVGKDAELDNVSNMAIQEWLNESNVIDISEVKHG